MTKPERWMEVAADLAHEALDAGDEKAYRRIMKAAESRADREGREARNRRK